MFRTCYVTERVVWLFPTRLNNVKLQSGTTLNGAFGYIPEPLSVPPPSSQRVLSVAIRASKSAVFLRLDLQFPTHPPSTPLSITKAFGVMTAARVERRWDGGQDVSWVGVDQRQAPSVYANRNSRTGSFSLDGHLFFPSPREEGEKGVRGERKERDGA